MAFLCLLGIILIQRLLEMSKGNENLKKLLPKLIFPLNKSETLQMLLLHALWFISILVEYYVHGKLINNLIFLTGTAVLIWCQYIRYQTMKLLGTDWTPVPVVAFDQKIIHQGPYRYIRHPNYLIVILEIAIVPLLGQCFWSAIVFSVLNLIFINRRIKIEEQILQSIPHYQEYFAITKRIIPFIF